MKRTLIIILTLFIFSPACFAVNNSITDIESSIFGYDYSNESDTKRVERIESYLYGSKKSGNINNRIQNIQNDIGYVKPQPIVKNETKSNQIKNKTSDYMNLKEDSSVEYPIVDKLEQELFNTNYKAENIYSRLERLEKQVFSKPSNEPLNDRVDKLASVVLPKRSFERTEKDLTKQELDNYYRSSGFQEIDNQSMPFHLAVLEEDLLKNNYNNDNISNRLNRLENKLFNRTFDSDTDIARMQRIIVAYDAKQKSYKYENNRRMQNMATASQIGGILLMILAMIL